MVVVVVVGLLTFSEIIQNFGILVLNLVIFAFWFLCYRCIECGCLCSILSSSWL